jgi:hypothetical protein
MAFRDVRWEDFLNAEYKAFYLRAQEELVMLTYFSGRPAIID